MRKKTESTELDELEENKISIFQWFLVIFIPLVFAVTVALIVFTVAGVNVIEKAKEISGKVPVPELFQKEDKKEKPVHEIGKDSKRLATLEKEIKDKEEEIEKLESIIDTRDKAVEKAEAEKLQLQTQMNELKKSQEDSKRAFKDIIRTYETMAPKKSAPIITEMNDQDAVKILSSMKADTLAKVLEQMSTADAARLTKKLTEQST